MKSVLLSYTDTSLVRDLTADQTHRMLRTCEDLAALCRRVGTG